MNALLESLLVPQGTSWTYFHRTMADAIPFHWHYHPEFELTLTLNSQGQRYVGDSVETFGNGDLVLVGPNLPHTWMSQEKLDPRKPHVAHVFWIRGEWLESLFAVNEELRATRQMMLGATRGLLFTREAADRVASLVAGLDGMSPPRRLARLLDILAVLTEDRGARLLCSPRADQAPLRLVDRPRIDKTLAHIHSHYHTEISVNRLAELAALSVSGLHRMFKRHTRHTIVEYVAQLRIGRACALLTTTDRPISGIADEVGYANLSHFNRQFLAIKQMTPREFRKLHRVALST